jgi:hypothetical protein
MAYLYLHMVTLEANIPPIVGAMSFYDMVW